VHLTLNQVYQLRALKGAKLLSGFEQLDKKVVEWVSVIETPVENFVRKNEFVLSTGIGCSDDEELLLQFVKEVMDSEASALAFATGRYIYEIPEKIISFAKKHSFPILSIPWDVRFGDIIQGVLEELNEQKNALVEKSEEFQQKFLHLILKGGGLSEIANEVYKKLQKPVIITDKRGQIKGESKQSKSLIANWNQYLHSEDYAASLLPFESNHLTSENMRVLEIGNQTALQMMIQSAREIQGYLIVGVKKRDDVNVKGNPSTLQLLEHAATAVALCFLRENTILETEMRLRDDFIWSLAKGTIKSWDHILSRSKSLGYNVNLPFACIIGYPENLKSIYAKDIHESSYEHWVESMIRRIEDEIFYSGRAIQCHTMSTYQRGQFIIFLEMKNEKIDKTIQHYIELINDRLNQLVPGLLISWGIGKTAGLKCFHESYQEAQTALEMGRRQKGPGFQSTYSDTRIDRALMSLGNHEELRKITDSTIDRLLKYDSERGIDLINTYVTYSLNRGNVSQTSRELNLHRQSLLYRLRKIEALTDCKLDNPDDVLLLDLSIKLWTVGILVQKKDE
jgi:purine catabolism regulator